jgi:predicted DCC family thiol-disulfide oxidoreductase YuxK
MKLTVFYDSLCPVCNTEVKFIRRRDQKRDNSIKFIDITEPSFNAENYGFTLQEAVASMHGFDTQGKIITGVEVFRQMYAAVGLGWVLSFTRLPIIRNIANFAYKLFAYIRPRFSSFNPADCTTESCELYPEKRFSAN